MVDHDSDSGATAPYYVSALLPSGDPHWGNNGAVLNASNLGSGATVRFCFLTSRTQTTAANAYGFAPMSESQKSATRLALATWSAVANINFVETTNISNADVSFATNRQLGASAGYSYYPSTSITGGSVFIANDSYSNINPVVGDYGFMTLIHEIGHAIGLKHPGNYNAGSSSGTEGPYLPASEDNYAYSVMSYYNNSALPASTYLTGPSIDDISTIQYLYGANMNAGIGNNNYTLTSTNFKSIWDPNGINSVDGGAQTANEIVDMRDGAFSYVGGTMSLALARGTRVNIALCGSGDDTIYTNSVSDRINGSGGTDTVTFGGAQSQYAISKIYDNTYCISGFQCDDILIDVERVTFSDTTIALNSVTATTFDVREYLCSNTDLITAFGNDTSAGASHFINSGIFENRATTSFDPLRYLAGHKDLMDAFGNSVSAAQQHFINYGHGEGRSATAFDAMEYVASNSDLIVAFGVNAVAAENHYILSGRFENRDNTSFNATAYLNAYQDLKAAFGNDTAAAELHYIRYGYYEHRTAGIISA